jgi:hypothetical protein
MRSSFTSPEKKAAENSKPGRLRGKSIELEVPHGCDAHPCAVHRFEFGQTRWLLLKFQITVRIVLFVIATLLAGAHFLRAGQVGLMVLCLAAPLLFLYRKRWILNLLQVIAYCAAVNWIVVAIRLVQMRQMEGRSWTSAAIILGAVAVFTLLAGLLLNSRSMKERYPR